MSAAIPSTTGIDAQAAHHAADVDRVVDRVLEAVAAGDVEVELGRPRAADLDGVDHEVRVRRGPSRRSRLRRDRRRRAQGAGRPARPSARPSRAGRRRCRGGRARRRAAPRSDRMSPSRLRVNSTLPAPTSTIRVIERPPRRWRRRRPGCAGGPGCGSARSSRGGRGCGRAAGPARRPGARPAGRRTAARGPRTRPAGSGSSVGRRDQRLRPDLDRPRAPVGGVAQQVARSAARAGPFGGERDDDGVRPEHRRGAGGHLPDLGALGVDERHLLELERGLEGGRVADAAAGHEQVAGVERGSPRRARRAAPRRRSPPPRRPPRRRIRSRSRVARAGPSSSSSSSSVATSVAEKVLVMTGTVGRAAGRDHDLGHEAGQRRVAARGRRRPSAPVRARPRRPRRRP